MLNWGGLKIRGRFPIISCAASANSFKKKMKKNVINQPSIPNCECITGHVHKGALSCCYFLFNKKKKLKMKQVDANPVKLSCIVSDNKIVLVRDTCTGVSAKSVEVL